ncbi:hypothetical protein HHI36_022748 [Cryptolaemus montrouzieri]|uniref:Uncharacterized protein n=1 Tax=Cryptolaemus montrouzieri TaxID=559131 RepID=A0ABD2N136_9CUCU
MFTILLSNLLANTSLATESPGGKYTQQIYNFELFTFRDTQISSASLSKSSKSRGPNLLRTAMKTPPPYFLEDTDESRSRRNTEYSQVSTNSLSKTV